MQFTLPAAFNVCMSIMLSVLLLLNYVTTVDTNVKVTLNVQPEIIRINENINITCTVNGIDNINNNLTRQWSKGPDLICYNGHPIDSNKYKEILTAGNQFKLQIKNVSESDVNYKYQCRYGFESQTKNIQASKDYFEYPPSDDLRAVVFQMDFIFIVELHFKKIFPLPRCTASIKGSSLPFNIISSKSVGNYYEVILRHQSKDKHQNNCKGEVVVKCKLIKEYIIPIKDLRRCLIEENTSIVVITIIFLFVFLFLMIIAVNKIEDVLLNSNCCKLKQPCLAINATQRRMSSSMSSFYSVKCSDHTQVFISSKEDKEINSKIHKNEKLMNNAENQKDFDNMDHV